MSPSKILLRTSALCAALALALPASAMASNLVGSPHSPLATHGQKTVKSMQLHNAETTPRYRGFIVKYRDSAPAAASTTAHTQSLSVAAARAGLNHSQAMGGNLTFQHMRRLGVGAELVHASRALTKGEAEAFMKELRSNPAVKYVQPDYIKHAMDVTPNDPKFSELQWDFTNVAGGMNAQGAWDASTGEGVVVAVIDTGYVDHADLDDNIVPGYDFVSYYGQTEDGQEYPDVAGDGDGRDPDAHDVGDWIDSSMSDWCGLPASDSSWHGTHVAGTIAAVTNNNIGIAGVAYGAKVEPVRVLGHCGGTTSDIADAIIWASGGHVDGVPDNENPADVLNLSLGGDGSCDNDPVTQEAIDGAIDRGTTVVVAAGNSSADAANFSPASCKGVLTVGSVGQDGEISWFSNYGPTVTLAAPGGDAQSSGDSDEHWIWSLGNSGSHEPVSSPDGDALIGMIGTSQATPHVAATAALMQAAAVSAGLDPLTPKRIKDIMRATAKPFGVQPPGSTPIGAGILDAAAAVAAATDDSGGDIEATLLDNRMPLGGQTGAAGDSLLYKLVVPEGARVVNLRTFGGSGDVSTYVSFEDTPTEAVHDYASTRPGNTETTVINQPQAGTYYLLVVGEDPFMNLNVMGYYQ